MDAKVIRRRKYGGWLSIIIFVSLILSNLIAKVHGLPQLYEIGTGSDPDSYITSKRGWNDVQDAYSGKRAWERLQGSWGKRYANFDSSFDPKEHQLDSKYVQPSSHRSFSAQQFFLHQYPVEKRRSSRWTKLKGSWGKRSSPFLNRRYLISSESSWIN